MWAFVVAGGLLVVAVAAAAWGRVVTRRIRVMMATETLTADQLRHLWTAAREAAGEGQFRYRCEVVGAAQRFDGGSGRSQLKGVACVWSRHRITHKYWERTRDRNGRSKRVQRSKVISEHADEWPVLVRDATGEVVVQLPGKGVHEPEKVLDRLERGGAAKSRTLRLGSLSLSLPRSNDTIGYQHEEWVVRPGRRLYVHGEATDASGDLVIGPPSDGGLHIVSTQSEERLLRDKRRNVTVAAWTARIAGGGGAVAAVVGAALTVAG